MSLPPFSPSCPAGAGRAARLALLLLALFALAACSNDPNPTPLASRRPDGSPWQVRYTGLGDEPRSLDPQFAYEQMAHRILEPVYDCLLEYNPFRTDPYELQPCLLTEIPHGQPAEGGGVEYLCHLRPGVLFHDDLCFPGGHGREVVAEDVLYAFKRIADPKVECPVQAALAEYLPGLESLYQAAKKGGRLDYALPLEGLTVVDPHTFRLRLSRPYPQIVYWMAMSFLAPVAREAVEYYDGRLHPGESRQRPEFAWHPVGTGPFCFVSYTPGQRVRLVRNPHYRTTTFPTGGWAPEQEALLRPFAGHALPLVDEVQFTIFREALPIWLLTRQGYLDNMGVSKDAYNSVVTASKELSWKYRQRGLTLEKDVEPTTYFINFNMTHPLLGSNRKLRQALCAAFDRATMLEIFNNGVPEVADQLIPPGVTGHENDLQNPYRYNLARARELLAEAGFPNGLDPKTGQPLRLTMDVVSSGGDERLVAEYEQHQFEQLGLRVEVIENNFARMLEKEDQNAFEIATGSGWGADYPDPENFFFLFTSKNFPPTGKNVCRFHHPEFDALFEKMAAMENSPERMALVHRMNEILTEECPSLLLYYRAAYVLVQPWAPRVQRNALLEGGLKYAVVDPVLRQQKQQEWNRKPLWPIAALLAGVAALVGYGLLRVRRQNV